MPESAIDVPESERQIGDRSPAENESLRVDGDSAEYTSPAGEQVELGDIGDLIRQRGLDPEDWIVVSTTLNEWDGPVKGGGKQRLRQWKVTLRHRPDLVLMRTAVHVPRLKRTRVGCAPSQRPETVLVEGDHQIPFHDPGLHVAGLYAIEELRKKHRLAEHIFLGDTGDWSNISKYDDHPATMGITVDSMIQEVYELLREKASAAPNVRRRKIKGNHDWRLEGEQLAKAERLYGIRAADMGDGVREQLVSLKRALHLDALGIELVEHPLGWEHGEIEIVGGPNGLVARHGWMTGTNVAARSMKKRGQSMIVGHAHSREHTYIWEPFTKTERQAAVCGCMCLVRDKRFPHFAIADSWLQGLIVVQRWPDNGRFTIEHISWEHGGLQWRDRVWTP